MLTKSDMQQIRSIVSEEIGMVKSELRKDIVQFKDDILKEIKDLRDDIVIVVGYRDTIEDHEGRIIRLEHPVIL